MDVFLKILKETGLAIVALALVCFLVWFAFQSQLPFLGQDIPDAKQYAKIDENDYKTRSGIEDEENLKEIFEVTMNQSQGFQNDKLVSTGTSNIFSSDITESDVPSERVTITGDAEADNSNVSGDQKVK